MFQLCFNLNGIHDSVGKALRTVSRGRETANSQALSFYFDPGLKHYLQINLIVGNIGRYTVIYNQFGARNFIVTDCAIFYRQKTTVRLTSSLRADYFQITFKKDSKLHNNVFSAIKKVGHRGYLSAKTAFLVDIGHKDGDVMLSW